MGRIICDEKKCSGCLACIVACLDQHYEETETDAVPARIYEKRQFEKTGLVAYVTRSCFHCQNPKCMAVCQHDALRKTEQGYIIPIREKCVGCRACGDACPHDVPRFDKENKLVKCDGCYIRVACGLEPACVRVCNTGALHLE